MARVAHLVHTYIGYEYILCHAWVLRHSFFFIEVKKYQHQFFSVLLDIATGLSEGNV